MQSASGVPQSCLLVWRTSVPFKEEGRLPHTVLAKSSYYASYRVAEAQPPAAFLVLHAALTIQGAFADPCSPEC